MRPISFRLFVVAALLASSSTAARAQVPGPLKISADGRHFTDAAGKPFFWLGDTAWPLFVEYPKDAAERYLQDRAKRGFTVVQGVLAWSHGGNGADKNSPPSPNALGQPIWRNDDPAQPNDAFFTHVDHLVAQADRNGLVLAILPSWGHYVNQSRILNQKNARAYGRYVGARYRNARNVVWVLGGDRTPAGFEAVWRELAAGLRTGGARQLMTYHPCGWTHSSVYFHHEPWLAFNMIETWTEWAKIYPAVAFDVGLSPRKPTVMAEGAYEDGPEYPLGPITPLLARRQAWWSFLAGGFHTYGQNQMWRMEPGWEKAFDSPGAQHVGRMRAILADKPWWTLYPDQTLFANGIGSEQILNAAMRTRKGDLALVYLSSQTVVRLHLGKILSKQVKATWISPQTGERKDAGTFETGYVNDGAFPGDRKESFVTPPHWEDALLWLEGV